MNKKVIIFIIILAAIVVGIYVYAKKAVAPEDRTMEKRAEMSNSYTNQEDAPATATPEAPINTNTPEPKKTEVVGQFSAGEELVSPDVQVLSVSFTGTEFTPNKLEINAGDWVFFKNNSTVDFWPASAPHPTHTDYPEFDAKKAYGPGKSFKFQFMKKGTWQYHSHLNPSITGTIVVK